MGRKVKTPSDPCHYRTPRGRTRTPSRVAQYVAQRTGQNPGTVEQTIHGRDPVHLAYARLLEAALVLGDERLVGHLLAPVEAVRAGASLHESPAELLQGDTVADASEDGPRMAFARENCAETRLALLRALRPRFTILARLIAALEREQRDGRAG